MTLFDKIIYIYFKDFFYHIYLQCFDTISLFFFFTLEFVLYGYHVVLSTLIMFSDKLGHNIIFGVDY